MSSFLKKYSAVGKLCAQVFLVVAILLPGSALIIRLTGSRPERKISIGEVVIQPGMTVAEFGRWNDIPASVQADVFALHQPGDTIRPVDGFGFTPNQLAARTKAGIAQYEEEHSMNRLKFTLHCIAALLFSFVVIRMLRLGRVTPKRRKFLYLAAVVIFGFGFASNPSPMGPLRDTIALFANPVEVVHPRLFALLTFLLFVVIANKSICAWVCQFGVLQDLLFRLNRNPADNRGILRQYKIPFPVANGVRLVFFIAISGCSFLWAFNLIGWIDPFNIFNPVEFTTVGSMAAAAILLLSVFIYRPWCHFFCPFGLAGWLFERRSIIKIRVDYGNCTACNLCSAGCPSDVMDAILRGGRSIPDCFACGTCITECPTGAISFSAGKRALPPPGKFSGCSS